MQGPCCHPLHGHACKPILEARVEGLARGCKLTLAELGVQPGPPPPPAQPREESPPVLNDPLHNEVCGEVAAAVDQLENAASLGLLKQTQQLSRGECTSLQIYDFVSEAEQELGQVPRHCAGHVTQSHLLGSGANLSAKQAKQRGGSSSSWLAERIVRTATRAWEAKAKQWLTGGTVSRVL